MTGYHQYHLKKIKNKFEIARPITLFIITIMIIVIIFIFVFIINIIIIVIIIIIRSTISTIIFLISIRDKMALSREQDTHFSTIP